jgi:hypothetical protein
VDSELMARLPIRKKATASVLCRPALLRVPKGRTVAPAVTYPEKVRSAVGLDRGCRLGFYTQQDGRRARLVPTESLTSGPPSTADFQI